MTSLKKEYLPLCAYTASHFGKGGITKPLRNRTLWSVIYPSLFCGAGAYILMNSPTILHSQATASIAMLSGAVGTVLHIAVDKALPEILKARNVAAKSGGRILRGAQAACISIPFATAAMLSLYNDQPALEPAQFNVSAPDLVTP